MQKMLQLFLKVYSPDPEPCGMTLWNRNANSEGIFYVDNWHAVNWAFWNWVQRVSKLT